MVTLTSFPLNRIPDLWRFAHEFADRNIDDYGPATEQEFTAGLLLRLENGETMTAVYADGVLVGAIGYCPLTARLGLFHGICFTQSVHGSGIPFEAVRLFIGERFQEGVEKIQAAYFADNRRVRRFLIKLGAEDEGYMRKQTTRHDKPIDMWLVAIHQKEKE